MIVFWAVFLTAFRYLTRFGSPRMGCVSSSAIRPRMFTAEPVRRLNIDSAELVHAPPYIRVGRENGFGERAASVTSQPLWRQLSFQASHGLGYGAALHSNSTCSLIPVP